MSIDYEDLLKFFDAEVVRVLSYIVEKKRIRSYREMLRELGISYYKLYKVIGVLAKLGLVEEIVRTEELPARVEIKVTEKGVKTYNHLVEIMNLLKK